MVIRVALLTGMVLLATLSSAADIQAGKQKAAVCAGCHGLDGKSVAPTFPNLAGQKSAYLESSLKAFRAKERSGNQAVVMYPVAANLSDEDIQNLAAYFSNLNP